MYKKLILPFLFLFDPEKIHNFTFFCIKTIFKIPFLGFLTKSYFKVENDKLKRNLFGLTFPNPVGIAADLIKMLLTFLNLKSLVSVLSKLVPLLQNHSRVIQKKGFLD